MLVGLLHGDDSKWQYFYEQYKSFIAMVGYKASGFSNNDFKDELIQRVMISVFHNGKFSYDRSRGVKFRTWLSKIIYFKSKDLANEIQKKSIETSINRSEGDSPDGVNYDGIEIPDDPFKRSCDREFNCFILRECLSKLRNEVEPKTYQAFELLTIHGEKAEDVAKATGMSIGNVYVSKNRCIRKCQKYIKEIEKEI